MIALTRGRIVPINSHGAYRLAVLVFIGFVILWKAYLITLTPTRANVDVRLALLYGQNKPKHIPEMVTDVKSFLGPRLWYYLYQKTELVGLKVYNLILFSLLCVLHFDFGRRWCKSDLAKFLSLFMFAYHNSTTLITVLGEQDEMTAMFLLILGVWLYGRTRNIFMPATCMGIALLFKYSIAVYCLGFLGYLMSLKNGKAFFLALCCLPGPFLLYNWLNDFIPVYDILSGIHRQILRVSYLNVTGAMLSTGMILWAWIAVVNYRQAPSEFKKMCLWISVSYMAFMLIFSNSSAASFICMPLVYLLSFSVGEWVQRKFDRCKRGGANPVIAGLVIIYFAASMLIGYYTVRRNGGVILEHIIDAKASGVSSRAQAVV